MEFGKRNAEGFTPPEVTGLDLLESYFMNANLQGLLSQAQAILADTAHHDDRVLEGITADIRAAINKKTGSDIGSKVTSEDVGNYVRRKMQRE